MQLWAATGNQGKINEYKALFESQPLELHSQNELSSYFSPEESGDTFVANARIKAKSLAAIKNDRWVFAEDSGLVVEGLGGMPGVHSARYAGDKAGDAENRAKLLKMLQIRSPQKREAYFSATVVLISPEREEFVFEGRLNGTISIRESGSEGFGYDPVFIPEGEEKTLAELGVVFKNKVSHRRQAGLALLNKLIELNLLQ